MLARFCLRFALLTGLLLLLCVLAFWMPWSGPANVRLGLLNAGLSHHLLRLLGVAVIQDQTTLYVPHYALQVAPECNGLFEVLVLWGALWSMPFATRRRILASIAAPVLILGLNVLRIANILLVGQHSERAARIVHGYVWNVVYFIAFMALVLLWTRDTTRESDKQPASPGGANRPDDRRAGV